MLLDPAVNTSCYSPSIVYGYGKCVLTVYTHTDRVHFSTAGTMGHVLFPTGPPNQCVVMVTNMYLLFRMIK